MAFQTFTCWTPSPPKTVDIDRQSTDGKFFCTGVVNYAQPYMYPPRVPPRGKMILWVPWYVLSTSTLRQPGAHGPPANAHFAPCRTTMGTFQAFQVLLER